MRLSSLVSHSNIQEPHKAEYCNQRPPVGMPPLNLSKLVLQSLVLEQRDYLKTPVAGIASLLLEYKNKEGAIMSIDEVGNGEDWRIIQVQGCKNKSSYRVASSFYWQHFLADTLKEYAMHQEAEVRYITMPSLYDIDGIERGGSQRIHQYYDFVKESLRMSFSQEEGLFIVDVQNIKKAKKN
jgi:hypothetical protein